MINYLRIPELINSCSNDGVNFYTLFLKELEDSIHIGENVVDSDKYIILMCSITYEALFLIHPHENLKMFEYLKGCDESTYHINDSESDILIRCLICNPYPIIGIVLSTYLNDFEDLGMHGTSNILLSEFRSKNIKIVEQFKELLTDFIDNYEKPESSNTNIFDSCKEVSSMLNILRTKIK